MTPDTVRPGMRIVVADTAANRATPFWSVLIGKEGLVVAVCGDGLWDVTLVGSHPLIPGVLPSRLTVVVSPSMPLPAIIWARIAPTIYLLGIIVILASVCYFIPSCVRTHV